MDRKKSAGTGNLVMAVIWIAAAMASVHQANGLAVSPGRTTLDFSPGLEKTVTIKVFNQEGTDLSLLVYARGDLAQSVRLSEESVAFSASEKEKTITYVVTLPDKLEPGLHEAEIVVSQKASSEESGKTTIGATVAVISQLHVYSPYPGKYLGSELHIKDMGQKIRFFIPIKNFGSEKIDSATPSIVIYDPSGNEMKRIIGSAINLFPKQNIEFQLDWDIDAPPGNYKAVAIVDYDGQKTVSEKEFIVGSFFLKPLDVSVSSFKLGQIAKFNIIVENIGNVKIEDAFGRIVLIDDAGRRVADTRSINTEIFPKETKELPAYWDTGGLDAGLFTGTLSIGYGDRSEDKQIRTIVEEDAIRTEIIGVTGLVIGESPSPGFKINWMYFLIGVLVMANAAWMFFYWKKKASQQP